MPKDVRQLVSAAAKLNQSGRTDRELLWQFAAHRDQSAFETLVKRHASLVLGVCRRSLVNNQDAEDACQAVFLILAKKANSQRWQPSIANWLYAAARKVAHNLRRTADRRRKREGSIAAPVSKSPLDQMTGRELLAILDEEIERLPAIYREPLVLCHLEGLSRTEAAARIGVGTGTIKTRLERGRKRLGDALSKRGIDLGVGLVAMAATASTGSSSPLLVESILATASGVPTASVSALVEGVAMNGFSLKAKVLVLAAMVAVAGFGLLSMPIAAGPQKAARTQQPALKEEAKSNDKPRAEKADETPKFKPIDPETIAAYEKIGATYGGFAAMKDGGPLWFFPGNDAAGKNLPGFSLSSPLSGKLQKLPAVKVPFGLGIGVGGDNLQVVTDADLRELNGIKNLTALILDQYSWTDDSTQLTDEGLKELKGLKDLTMLRLGGAKRVTDRGLKELKDLKNLTTLTLLGTKVTDEGLKELKDFKKLSSLALGGLGAEGITDAGLKELKEIKNLTALSLNSFPITDDGLKELRDLKNLTSLSLFGAKVTDSGLTELANLTNLTSLNLGRNALTDAGIRELKNLVNLKSLCLVGGLGGVELANTGLKDLKNLTTLDLTGNQFGDAGLKELKQLKNLTSLNLRFTSVTDRGLDELKDLTELTELSLSGTKVTDKGLKSLRDLKKLTSLDLNQTKVTGFGLKELGDLQNFTSLTIGGPQMTDYGLKDLKEIKSLILLDLRHATITDAGLVHLKDLKSLTSVDLSHTMVADAGLNELTELKNLTRLELGSTEITDVGLKKLKELKNLTHLDLSYTKATDVGLIELKELTNLVWLDVYGSKVTKAGLKEIEKSLPRCRIVGPYRRRE